MTMLPSSATPSISSPFSAETEAPFHIVKESPIHGRGVFALRAIPAETRIIEYCGERIDEETANERGSHDPENPFHTFFFSMESGLMIDGHVDGNDARWINHSCAPNCETREEEERIYVYALRDIAPGEELNYDYGLVIEARYTAKLKNSYACRCGATDCRHTMLALKRRKS